MGFYSAGAGRSEIRHTSASPSEALAVIAARAASCCATVLPDRLAVANAATASPNASSCWRPAAERACACTPSWQRHMPQQDVKRAPGTPCMCAIEVKCVRHTEAIVLVRLNTSAKRQCSCGA